MVASRPRPKGAVTALFGSFTLAFTLLPAPVGTQDLAALFSYQAEPARWSSAWASPFGTIHPGTYSFPRPVGTVIPRLGGYRLASLDPRTLDVTGALSREADEREAPGRTRAFPSVERRLKGDSLRAPPPPPSDVVSTPSAHTEGVHAALTLPPEPEQEQDFGLVPEDAATDGPREDGVWPPLSRAELAALPNPAMDTARLYFGTAPTGVAPGAFDGTALESPEPETSVETPAPPAAPAEPSKGARDKGGETVAGKGEVTGKDKRPLSPAERLHLSAKARAKAEKCLANAVYFESRGEQVRGQIAVAQVVMNRVFSEFYPDNVCDVVYQNAHRHLACQFTFACDGIRDVVTEPEAWRRATRIAKDTLDGKLWLDDVGKATHYHAYWVRPSWVHEMRKLYRLGVHTFYRPRAWGNGAGEPVWGDAKTTAALAKTL